MSATGAVAAAVILADVAGTFGVTVTGSISITGTHTTHFTLHPGQHMYAAYGVYRFDTSGTYYKFAESVGCSNQSFSATALAPSYQGWNNWM